MNLKSDKFLLNRGVNAKQESKYLDFKSCFDKASTKDWCEIIKDIAAMANSGGGIIVFGIKDNGDPAENCIETIENVDPAVITDKIFKYTNCQYSGFDIREVEREDGNTYNCLLIRYAFPPLVFIKPGTYPIEGNRQKTAFKQGVIYYRHGAKSETAFQDDIAQSVELELMRRKNLWLKNIRQVTEAPASHKVHVYPKNAKIIEAGEGEQIRVTQDPNAPAVRVTSRDEDCPNLTKHVIEKINESIKEEDEINPYDLLCIRHNHSLEERPELYYKPQHGVSQYSDSFIGWLLENYKTDPDFFRKERDKYRS